MNKNEYKSAEFVEMGKPQDLILGVKDMMEEDNGSTPTDRFPAALAKFDE